MFILSDGHAGTTFHFYLNVPHSDRKIFDSYGRLIHQVTIAENSVGAASIPISTSAWAPGIYFVMIETPVYRYETSLVVGR